MPETSTIAATEVDRRSIVDFLQRAIAAAETTPLTQLHRRHAGPSGLSLELLFDRPEFADIYAPRLFEHEPAPGQPLSRIYMLSQAGQLPVWVDPDFEPAAFHALLGEHGLRAAYPYQEQVWQALDERSGVGIHLARAPQDLPLWHAGSPLRQHLFWLLRKQGKRIAHAAALGEAGRGILLFGNGGAGKSGTTLAGVAAGLKSVGDDYVALGGSSPPVATPLFRIFKQDRRGLQRVGLSDKTAALPENWMRKVEFDPTAFFPGCLVESLEIRALVVPRIAHAAKPCFVPISGGEAMRSLIPTNLLQFPGEPDDGMAYYAGLARRLPAYRLELSADAQQCGAALRDFIGAL